MGKMTLQSWFRFNLLNSNSLEISGAAKFWPPYYDQILSFLTNKLSTQLTCVALPVLTRCLYIKYSSSHSHFKDMVNLLLKFKVGSIGKYVS